MKTRALVSLKGRITYTERSFDFDSQTGILMQVGDYRMAVRIHKSSTEITNEDRAQAYRLLREHAYSQGYI